MGLALLQRSDVEVSINVDDRYSRVWVGVDEAPCVGEALVIGSPEHA